MEFEWTYNDAPSPTTTQVQQRLAAGKGCVVVGRAGTGKTRAVRQAVNGSPWVDLREGEHQLDFFFTELAAQLSDGQRIVDALATRNAEAVFRAADGALGGAPLVIDRGEHLQFDGTWAWDEPVDALWRPDQAALARWIQNRLAESPLVIIARGRRDFFSRQERIRHFYDPLSRPFKSHGFRDWPALGNALRGLPAGLRVGALLLELMPGNDWNYLVRSLSVPDALGDDEERPGAQEVLRELLGVLKDWMPGEWRHVLATVHALDGAPADVVERVLGNSAATARYLEDLGAIERRSERLSLMPSLLLDGPIATLLPAERHRILTAAAQEMLQRVPVLERPDARSAEWIVRAHALYVELGDFEAARRTARFHLGGLVRLARETSLAGDRGRARRLYEIIEPLTINEPRVASYVIHYLHMNGHWAEEMPSDVVLDGLQRGRAMWPENALWWQHETEILLELGRRNDALRTIDAAYEWVAEHPRRDLFLRVRPASRAMQLPGAEMDALRILDPLDGAALASDLDTRVKVGEIFERWRRGVEVPEVGRDATGHLVFHDALPTTLERLAAADFRAECRALERAGRASTPLGAFDKLARTVADELRPLVQTPSTRLTVEEVRRKGTLIGLIDLRNSDIGLARREERWILGRFEGRLFVPVLTALSPMHMDPLVELPPAGPNTLYFGKFDVHRDGFPHGAPRGWNLAGSGRSVGELWSRLKELSGRSDG